MVTPIKAIYDLFLGKPIDFYSPHTLDETYQYLQEASERDKRKPSISRRIWGFMIRQHRHFLLITLDVINTQSYSFRAQRDVGGNIRIFAHGEVYEDNSGVKVTGIIHVNILTRFILLLSLVFVVVVLLGAILTGSWDNLPVLILFMIISILLFKYCQNRMYNQIYSILGKSKNKTAEII